MARAMTVESLMSTALVCVQDTDTVATAHQEMLRACIHHLPVVDAHRNLVGILSSTDVLEHWSRRQRERVGECMSRAPVTVSVSTSTARAADMMLEQGFRSLPVVASDGHLVGIITETDLLRASRDESARGSLAAQ
jgi:CBS domain-containing membrane protein